MRRSAVVHYLLIVSAVLILFMPACKKPPAAVPGPAAAAGPDRTPDRTPAAAPTIQLGASKTSIQRGEQTTLTWSSTNASSIVIDNGVGNVAESGSLVVSPTDSVTYTATARGNGEAKASTRITVLPPAAPAGGDVSQSDIMNLKRLIEQGVIRPIFFAYDKAELSAEARQTLEQNSIHFRRYPGANLIVEGHCDERGTEEYNLALGDRRAQATRDYLTQLGVEARRLETISYGEERPFVPGQTESAWSQNRRAHFTVREF